MHCCCSSAAGKLALCDLMPRQQLAPEASALAVLVCFCCRVLLLLGVVLLIQQCQSTAVLFVCAASVVVFVSTNPQRV
jgi:hypothetical protein